MKSAECRSITILLLALSAQLSANHFSARRGHSKKLSVQKSSASHIIDLACPASQYPDLCKSSLRANSNISENAGPEEIIGAAMDLSSAETTESYLHSKQLLTTSTNANFTGAVNDCLEYLHDESSKDESSMSIQQAVNSAPDFSDRRFVIYVKTGVYEETVRVPPNKTNLMFVGDGMDKTVIRGSMSVPSLPGVPSTYDSATVGRL